ncbi:MAG: GMC family oxidoreductase [Candidatus Caenarcaniphilales bacterium]|nr:GMC family oxidoreductase [Candidatus Caenarcaniphilales bacterium]
MLLFALLLAFPFTSVKAYSSIEPDETTECFKIHKDLFNYYLPRDLIEDKKLYDLSQKQIFDELKFHDFTFCSKLQNLKVPHLKQDSDHHYTRILADLSRSSNPDDRKLVFGLRGLYLSKIYGSNLGEYITGYKPSSIVVSDLEHYLKDHTPKFSRGNLQYNYEEKKLKPKSAENFDYLIVGAGPAGAVIAHELSRAGKHVMLVDQGPLIIPGALLNSKLPQLRENQGIRVSDDGGVIFRNGNAFGGGAAINIDLAFQPTDPTVKHRIAKWVEKEQIPSDLWEEKKIKPAYDWVEKHIGTREALSSEINANNHVLWDGALALGLSPDLYALNSYRTGESPSSLTLKRSPVDHLIFEALKRESSSLSILPRFKAGEILFQGRKAIGIEGKILDYPFLEGELDDPYGLNLAKDQSIYIQAKNVILSAGSLGTPLLLLRSGIENEQIGKGIIAHPSLPVIGLYSKPVRNWEGIASTVFLDDFALSDDFILEATSSDPADVASLIPGNGEQVYGIMHEYAYLAGFGVMVIDESQSKNEVSIDQNGDPIIKYKLSESDQRKLLKGVDLSLKIHFAAGAKKVIIPNFQLFDGKRENFISNQAEWERLKSKLELGPFQNFISSAHMQATCKLGRSPATSVVDPHHRLWNYQNLYIVDSSIFPSSIGANPMQSIYTIAKLFSDRMLEADEDQRLKSD